MEAFETYIIFSLYENNSYINKFFFEAYFVVLYVGMVEEAPIILSQPFLKIADVLTLRDKDRESKLCYLMIIRMPKVLSSFDPKYI